MEQVIAKGFDGVAGNSGGPAVGPHIENQYQGGAEDHRKPPFHHEEDVIFRRHLVDDVGKDVRDQEVDDGTGKFDEETENHGRDMRFYILKKVFHAWPSSCPFFSSLAFSTI